MNDLRNWKEVTSGIYRFVIAAKVCYEIHLLHWSQELDVLTAKASLFIVGSWHDVEGERYFERECLLKECPVVECLAAAVKDDAENNEHGGAE